MREVKKVLLSQKTIFLWCFLWNWTFNRMKSSDVLLRYVHSMMSQLQTESVFRRWVFNIALDVIFRAVLTVIWNFGLVSLYTNISGYLSFFVFNLKALSITPLNGFHCFVLHLIFFLSLSFFFNQELEPEKKQARIHHETRIHILNLLITSLECSPPSLALYLLGYELKKPVSTTNLQDPGMKRKNWSGI